jgi:hypothetical protein
MFSSYEKNDDPQRAITFGDGNQGLIKGLVQIAISLGHSISNVFLVESLGYNLLFMSQLCKMGYNCLFTNVDCWDHASSPKVLRKETALAEAA